MRFIPEGFSVCAGFKALSRLALMSMTLLAASLLLLSKSVQAQTTPESLATRGFINLAVANEPPMSLLKPDGSIGGAVPEIIAEGMRRLGVPQTRGAAFEFAAMIPALLAGQVDSIGGALLINEDRCRAVLFSEPLVTLQVLILAPKGNPNRIDSIKSLVDNPNLKLIVVQGTGPAARANALGVRNTVVLSENLQQIEALRVGRGDATLIPEAVLAARPEIARDFDVVRPPESEFPMLLVAAAFRRTDTALRDRFDGVLAQMKADGTLARILASHKLPQAVLTAGKTRKGVSAACS